MKQQAPVDPPPRIGDEGLGSALAPGFVATTEVPTVEQATIEPEKSFIRGVAVGLPIMVPIWAWLIIRFLL